VCIIINNNAVKATLVSILPKFFHLVMCVVDISLGKVNVRLCVIVRRVAILICIALQYSKDVRLHQCAFSCRLTCSDLW
jgi:hypothetical protein